jgi:hypothetical protein
MEAGLRVDQVLSEIAQHKLPMCGFYVKKIFTKDFICKKGSLCTDYQQNKPYLNLPEKHVSF